MALRRGVTSAASLSRWQYLHESPLCKFASITTKSSSAYPFNDSDLPQSTNVIHTTTQSSCKVFKCTFVTTTTTNAKKEGMNDTAIANNSNITSDTDLKSKDNSHTDISSDERFEKKTIVPTSRKSMFEKLYDQYWPERQKHRIVIGERFFRAAQRRAMDPIWYTDGRINTDFRSKHAILALHVWFLHRRLIVDSTDPHLSLLIQEELFDTLWNDTLSRIRANKDIHELMVNKHLKDVQQLTFQMCTHFDHCYSEYKHDPQKRVEELSKAIWVHVLNKDEHSVHDHVMRLVAYVEYQMDNIVLQLPDVYFQEGRVAWGDIPNFSKMLTDDGKALPKSPPLKPDQMETLGLDLPSNWLRVLTDAGDAYYWNLTTNQTQWDKPIEII